MKLKTSAAILALATGLAGATSASASAPDERELWEMLKKSAATNSAAMAARSDFKGVQSAEEIARILDPNVANP